MKKLKKPKGWNNMARGEYMRAFRDVNEISLQGAGKLCGCSGRLILMLETWGDEVTHPRIAERIAKVYAMPEEMKLSMMPANYRPGPDYDPDRYTLMMERLIRPDGIAMSNR